MTLSAAFANGNGSTNGGGWGNGNGGGFGNGVGNPHGVPEIDASAGLLALAAVGVALVLAWEVSRRGRA
ncbi:VPEID-CTERM sorting domain-containing protein [Leisingera sp. SS27]|uniref:VPEID-CTERM sorting domain-containing protein n=1 Tax=Leisingera sp. SS27 TaxID=2979462 RepID=UPI00232FC34E|nr:VPEID-CTERM sorting domain-containing protein [Leisingera sp. SS27]MDC0659347.1 VPEID-CTERM sorting domain-containing protein [Leisingera sp. SS27]